VKKTEDMLSMIPKESLVLNSANPN
jgi:hypothetical protein